MNLPQWLGPYLERDSILREIARMFTDGNTDAEIARRFGQPEYRIQSERVKWGMIRETECPDCGNADYRGECGNKRCRSNWVLTRERAT